MLHELEHEDEDMRDAMVSARDRGRPGPEQRELFAPPPDPTVEELRGHAVDAARARISGARPSETFDESRGA